MAGGNQIQFGVGFNVNESGLNKLKQSLKEIQQISAKDIAKNMGVGLQEAEKELIRIRSSAIQVETALQKAFNTQLGTVNITKFNAELQKLNLPQLVQHFNNAGAAGQHAFNQLASAALQSNIQLKQTFSIIENMKTTLSNTIKWNIASGAVNAMTRSVQSAFNYVKALDSSLTDIRIVTGQSREEMARFAVEANNSAQALGRQTKEYTNAALAFYQQGLNADEVRTRTEASLKAQNITGAGNEIVDQLTAVWNGYNVSIAQTEEYVDKLAAVADSSASNMSELATGMSKVASVANNMGVDIDQLTAQLATIIATTRQAPQTVGNALKTIYARINDIKTGSDEAEISLGNYTSKMASLGISVLDANGRLRDTGDVMEEIGAKWTSMTREQQIYLAQTMAGQRQMNNLVALFDNWQKYSEMLNVSLNAEGALNEKNARYMDSLAAHLNQFKTATEGLQQNLINSDDIKKVVDAGTSIINVFTNVTSSIGGARTILIALSSLLLKTFSTNIADGILKIGDNFAAAQYNVQAFNAQIELMRSLTSSLSSNNEVGNLIAGWTERIANLQGTLSAADLAMITEAEQTYVQLADQAQAWEENRQAAENYYNQVMQGQGDFPQQVDTAEGAAATKTSLIKEMQEALKEVAGDWENANKAASNYEKKLQQLIDAQSQTNKNKPKDLTAQWEQLDAAMTKVAASAEKLTESDRFLDQQSEEYKKLTEAVEHFNEVKNSGSSKDSVEYREAAQALAKAYNEAISSIKGKMEEVGTVGRQVAEGVGDQVKAEADKGKEAIEGMLKASEAKAFMTNIIGIAGAIGGLAGAAVSIMNIRKLWDNDSLSSSEKLLRTLQSMAFVLPMITTNISKLVTSISGITKMTVAASGASFNLGAGFKVLGASMTGAEGAAAGVTASLGSVAAAAGIVAAALAVIGTAVYLVYRHYTRFDRTAKQAEQAAENLKIRARETAQAAQDLKSAFDDYDSLVETLNGCVKGTQEWYEALEDVNQKVLEILDEYPQLLKYQGLYSRNSQTGQLEFNQAVVNKAIQDAATYATSAQFASMLGAQFATQARNTSNQVDLQRSITGFSYMSNNNRNYIDQSNAVAKILISHAKELANLSPDEYKAKVRELLGSLNGFSEQWVTTAEKYSASLTNLVNAQNEAAQSLKNLGTVIASQGLKDLGIEASNAETVLAGSAYTALAEQIAKKFTDEVNSNLTRVSSNAEAQAYWDRYQHAAGTHYQLARNGVRGGPNNRTFAYLDENHKDSEISLQEMATTIGAYEALKELGSAAQAAATTLNTLKGTVGTAQKSGIEDFISTGYFNIMSQTDFEKLQQAASEDIKGYLLKAFNATDIDALAQKLGYETGEDLINAFQRGLEGTSNSFDAIVGNLFNKVATAFKSLNPNQYNVDTQTMIAQLLTEAFNTGGKAGLDNLTEVLAGAGENADELAEILTDIDWSVIDLDTLIRQLEIAGISCDEFQVPLEKVIELMKEAAEIDFDQVIEKYQKAMKVAQGLSFGESISKEDYNDLTAYDIPGLRDMFQMGRDGMYTFYGSAQEIVEKINALSFKDFEMGLKDAAEKVANLNAFLKDVEDFDALKEIVNSSAVVSDKGNRPLSMDYNVAQQQLDVIKALAPEALGVGQIEDIQQKIDNQGLSIEDAQKLLDIIKTIDLTEDGVKEKLKDAEGLLRDFTEALSSDLQKLDEDVNEEEFAQLRDTIYDLGNAIDGIDASVQGDLESSANIAEAILRFDDAIKDVTDHYEDWLKALNSGVAQDEAKAITELRDAYGDLLDLDGDKLSGEFLHSTDNLELLKDAINNVDGAYEELQQRAQSDILLNEVKVDLNDEEFWGKYNTFHAELDALDLPSLDVGANLDQGNFKQACEEMINAAHMTQQQATAYLSACGVDAEVDYEPVTKDVTSTVADLVVSPGDPVEYTYANPATGVPTTGVAQGLTVSENPHEVTETRATGAFTLKVKSAEKASGGDFKFNNSHNGGGGGGGKKGGGGGSKAKKPKKQKPFKAKIDPYHDVNIKIGDVQEGLEKLGKQRDKLIGKDATDNLREQIELLERQKELLKEKEAIAERELQRHKEELEKMGAVFDGDVLRDGEYERLLEQKKKQVNDAITYFNGLSADEQEAYQEYLTQLQDEYKELEEALKDYDDTVQLMDDLDLDYQDLINQQIELAIEAFDLEINVKLDLKDAEKDFNEFKKKVIDQIQDDDYAGLAASTADMFKEYYNVGPDGVAGGLINDLRSHSKEILHEIEIITNGGFSQIYGDNLAAATEDLKKYNDELMDALEEAQEVIDETHDHFLDAIDAMQDAFDTQQEGFDKLDDLLSHDMDILQLIHGEENFDEMDKLWEQQIAQDTSRLQALQEQQQYWKDRLDDYEEGTDEWKAAMENWQIAFEATNEAMMQSVENLQSKWENSINSIMSKLRNDTFGGDMDAALEDWDKMTWHEERYLDGIERANGLLELQHNYIDMINNTNDPKIQAKLAELEEKQLDALANKEHLREIDLKLAQQQLTVLQAQMALEDAQQAKTKMRLRRDSQGNYTYQFVADEDDIQQKTQDYMKALSEYRSMANDSLHQDLEDLRDYTQEYYDALQEAQMKYGDDQQALLEEQERLYEMYFGDPDGYINALHNDALSSMTDAQEAMFTNLYGLNQNMEEDLFIKFLGPDSEVTEAARNLLGAGGEIPSLLDAFVNDSAATAFANIDEMTQQTLAGDHGLLPEWSSALWNIADQYDTMFVPRVVEAMNYLQRANQAYVDGLAIMQQAAGRTAADIADGLAYDTAYTNALNDASEALIATQKEQVEASQAVYKALMDNAAAFQNLTGAALDAANANYAYWLSLNGQVATSLPYSYSRASQGTVGQSDYTDAPANGGSNTAQQNSNYNHIASYASGGFTGDWDVSNGKLAVLHEKELVLNEADTKNMLDAVKITRTIFDRVQNMNTTLLGNLSAGNALDLAAAAGETILQDVIINADFPGVEDAAQIKQAFNELINLASQKVSKNRRAY